jgi:hypothetical protein
VKIVNRRFYDEYFFNLATNFNSATNNSVIYDPLLEKLSSYQPGDIIFCQDTLTDALVHDKLGLIPDIPVSIVSSVYQPYQDRYFNNVNWLHAGSDILFQQQQYQDLEPVANKTSRGTHWCCLGLLPRPHRLAVACILLGLDYNRDGIRVDPGHHNNPSWQDFWGGSGNMSEQQLDVIETGWKILKTNSLPKHTKRYNVPPNNNALNFSLNLSQIYTNTAVEIVCETTFFNQGIFVSEKYQHSVFGFNFPIILSNAGTVEYLRVNGFDMFDDIINHDYDLVQDPFQRLWQAITTNQTILQNKDLAWHLWHDNKDRLSNNFLFAKHDMYNHFSNKFMCSATNLA